MTDKFYSFERALRELNLREEELKRLVSEGEIRAFRDEDKMKFRREDVDRLRTTRGSDAGTGPVDVTSEGQEAGGETVADAEDLILDEEEDLEMEEEPGMATAPIASIEEEPEPIRPAPKKTMRPAPPPPQARKPASRTSRVRPVELSGAQASPFLMVLLVLSTLCMLYGVFVVLSTASNRTNSMTQGLTDMMYSMGLTSKSS